MPARGITTKLAVESLGDLALIAFRPAKIAKSEKIIETLEAMGTEASELGAGQRDKAGKFISRLLDELMPQPMGVRPNGRLMPMPQELGTAASQMGGSASEKYAKFIGGMTEEIITKRREARIRELALTGRDLAGKPFGGWPHFNETFNSPGAVQQLTKDSCVSACGERLSKGNLKQVDLIQKLGAPVDCRKLAAELGPEWTGEYVNALKDFDAVMSTGEWSATFFDRYARGLPHSVTVEGITEAGSIKIFDPWEASSYEMTRQNFSLYWNGGAVYRK